MTKDGRIVFTAADKENVEVLLAQAQEQLRLVKEREAKYGWKNPSGPSNNIYRVDFHSKHMKG